MSNCEKCLQCLEARKDGTFAVFANQNKPGMSYIVIDPLWETIDGVDHAYFIMPVGGAHTLHVHLCSLAKMADAEREKVEQNAKAFNEKYPRHFFGNTLIGTWFCTCGERHFPRELMNNPESFAWFNAADNYKMPLCRRCAKQLIYDEEA